MTVRMRHTRSHTGNRRSHHALKVQNIAQCQHCAAPIRPHTVCMNCGRYQERQVVDVLKKLTKKEKKRKQKELAAQEAEAAESKPLDAASLSKK
ncbi:MAG: 50S ribosomal protein L32 [Candidatus Ryanbacteria bacterium RIFCSPLOWO2_12_FULL_47_9c]|uniref:Large ribosomal subunit protein bL32 n=3 Tax=Parcubacteria group TaxID=1794811 RepID=A0A1G2H401_9BACT|nr:MAG: 50S ribosomal protein L32 [Candidatus Giovannonibacteria bacterium GW2011_GWB1_47_6b]KKU86256.1 MAG: 50S ribosomal protein L32 [Parcubacteria group bacterium GW2011_GWA1_47_9]OGZ56424.1 MAG: 50S ribosomal protein L32 [Candidatus Ryanbacteria bacterium RIFCSPLOWO2_02_FULL_47_14]OGZ56708.1 MAG: 50S ribosomal protein L32 [Candidatus Ryanbacteria bacterium RIFCSPLOWO2_12_FULL_47_9c]